MERLQTKYGALTLRSPLILASSGITKAHGNVQKADENGAGAVVLKTRFEEPLMAHSPTPRFIVIRRGGRDYSSVTNISYEQGYVGSIDDYCEEIRRCKQDFETKIIASIGCSKPDTWRKWAEMVGEAGADALEMNLSCPHSDYVMGRLGDLQAMIEEAVPAVKSVASIPVHTKLTPQVENPVLMAKIMENAGADSITAFNRHLGFDLDVETQEPVLHGGYGGHGGPWSIHYALRWISEMSPLLRIPVSATGGVVEWQDVVKYIMCGAATVQVCFLVYTYGYQVIKELNAGLLSYMERYGYSSTEDFRGLITPKIKTLRTVDRTKNKIAEIDPEACIGCKRCTDICIYDGISFENKKASINKRCDGCGLCVYFCPKRAIFMTDSSPFYSD